MTRCFRRLITPGLLGISLCILIGAAPKAIGASQSKPNIVLIMPDDIGYGDYSCLGNPVMKTPAVDGFWAQSVRLTDFHVSPTCAPTRAALLSGRHDFKNGVTHTIFERERLSLKTTTVAEVLWEAGYATGIFGKWHQGDEAPYRPDKRGFDEVYIHGAGGIGQTFPGSCGDAPGNMYTDPALLHNGKFEKSRGYCTDLFFNQAIRWMDSRRKQTTPFFAYITPNVAHTPLQCPEESFKRYVGKVPENVAKFFGMIETLDTNFGRLLAKLAEWNIETNTIVIFLGSDNGGTGGVKVFNAGMRGSKGSPYQGGTRVPCFIRWPGKFPAGRDVSALAAHIDIFPTLAEIADVRLDGELRKQVEGRSLMPLLTGADDVDWPDRFLVTHLGRWPAGEVGAAKFSNCSIRNARFTLVNNSELYDLQSDPSEAKDVMADFPEVANELRAEYERWWEEVQPLLVNENAIGPKVNPFKELYWKQFGGGPTPELIEQMDPARKWQQAPKKKKR